MTKDEIVQSVSEGRSFEGATIKGIDLTGADLRGGRFIKANFRYSILKGVNLSNADLQEANLRHVVLTGANLSGADLRGADLSHVNLKGANLAEAKLDRAILKGAVGISQNVFFTQEILDTLNAENKIQIDDDVLTVFTRNRPRYHIVPAVRFTKVEDGTDTEGLLGKVKTEEEYKVTGIEAYNTSALLGETVYAIENGFLGSPYDGGTSSEAEEPPAPMEKPAPKLPAAVAAQPMAAKASPPPEAKVMDVANLSDEELLSNFLLKNLK